MSDSIRGFTIEQYLLLTQRVFLEVRNLLSIVIGYSELVKEKMDPSHPAFPHLEILLQSGNKAQAIYLQFHREYYRPEFYRRRSEAEEAVCSVNDPLRGFTIEGYASLTQQVLGEIRDPLSEVIRYSQLLKETLGPSHPFFLHIEKVLQAGQTVFTTVGLFDQELRRRKNQAEETEGGQP